jgi:signal transduction histidine kinase
MQASLHDSVGAMLFSIGAGPRPALDAADNRCCAHRLGRLESDVSAASLALREALLALSESSPESGAADRTGRALPQLPVPHRRAGPAVQLGEVRPRDAERTTLLVSAVREGLLNVEKHAAPAPSW